MVTTSMAAPAAVWAGERGADAPPAPAAHGGFTEAEPAAVACTLLTPSGALLARAMVRPRPTSLPDDAYAVELSQVQPQGALEPLLRGNPQVVLRMPHEAQLALRIDHIIGPRERRTYFLQALDAAG